MPIKVIYPGREVVEKINIPFYGKANLEVEGDGLVIIDKRGKCEISLNTGQYTVKTTGLWIHDYSLKNKLTKEKAQEILKKAVGEKWNHDDLF